MVGPNHTSQGFPSGFGFSGFEDFDQLTERHRRRDTTSVVLFDVRLITGGTCLSGVLALEACVFRREDHHLTAGALPVTWLGACRHSLRVTARHVSCFKSVSGGLELCQVRPRTGIQNALACARSLRT
eukprot:m.10222 g.10222  ORF g.10222 m.10222 type:complete len:128 (+) comp4285_c0_seq1:3173-3556(+)